MADRPGYDTSIGTKNRSAISATKLWGLIIGIVFLIGIVLIVTFFLKGSSTGTNGRIPSENTASRPAEP